MYKLIRSLLFSFDPEKVHEWSMAVLMRLTRNRICAGWIRQWARPPQMPEKEFLGLRFRNPVGLAAGFDKNAKYLAALDLLGFGHVEIGTVTPIAQDGNPKPRLFRLPADNALINRMGFNNEGMDAVAKRLQTWRNGAGKGSRMIIGGNIGKNKQTANEDAWKDYLACFKTLHPLEDYFVVNVSSPNTPGLRALQDADSLRNIFHALQEHNRLQEKQKPVLLKIAPDLVFEQVDDIIALTSEVKIDGLIVANTSISRDGLRTAEGRVAEIGAGGLSGKPIRAKSTEMLGYIHQRAKNRLPLIGGGGVFSGADAKEKMAEGASLVQVWTGFVYEGPLIVKKICKAFA
ncbi:MAG TPA: dihydroorotate dehydrogenase (quinone) [Chitinophagaceae bacterium]|nr:dihydroorotate dehydrogenase (quinone) [Chitinophagaceae bacterium]